MHFEVEASDRVFYQSKQLEISSSVARRAYYPTHHHPIQFQLEVVLRGATECGIGRRRFSIPQQCYSVVNPDVEHYNVTQRWKHALFIIFPRQTLDETAWHMYRLLSRPVTFSDLVASYSTALAAVLQVLFQEAAYSGRPGQSLLFDSALIQLSVVLLRSLQGNHSARPLAAHASPSHTQIVRAVDLIHSNYEDDLSLDDLARVAAMSRYHFLRSFKTQVGTTPYAYLQRVRLQTAVTLLRSSSRSITDIALSCGFNSPSRFSATFRQYYQCRPSEYRRAHMSSHQQ